MIRILIILSLGVLSAAEALPDAVLAAKRDYDAAVQKAEQEKNRAIEAARVQMKSVLEAEKVKATKSGNLDLALKIRDMIDGRQEATSENLLGEVLTIPKKNTVNIDHARELAKRYSEIKQTDWDKMGGVMWTVPATSVFDSKMAIDGNTLFLAPAPSDVWRRGPTDDPQPWNGKGDMVMMWSNTPDRAVKSSLVDGMILNPDRKMTGKITVFVGDEGRSDNSGSIRVKVFLVK
jgi:hypothetical protein